MGNIIAIILLVLLVLFIVYSLFKKKGRNTCSCNCSSCIKAQCLKKNNPEI